MTKESTQQNDYLHSDPMLTAFQRYDHYAHGKTMRGGTLTNEGWIEHKVLQLLGGTILAPVMVVPDRNDPSALPTPVRDLSGRLCYASPYPKASAS